MANTSDELAKLGDLLERGLITRAEFDTMKAELLRPSLPETSDEGVAPSTLSASQNFEQRPGSIVSSVAPAAQVATVSNPRDLRRWFVVGVLGACIAALVVVVALNSSSSSSSKSRPTTSDGLARDLCATQGNVASAKALIDSKWSDLSQAQQTSAIALMFKNCPGVMQSIKEQISGADSGNQNPSEPDAATPNPPQAVAVTTTTEVVSALDDMVLTDVECSDMRAVMVQAGLIQSGAEAPCSQPGYMELCNSVVKLRDPMIRTVTLDMLKREFVKSPSLAQMYKMSLVRSMYLCGTKLGESGMLR